MTIHPNEKFSFEIPNDTGNAQEVQEAIIATAKLLEYCPRSVFGIRLALEEAFVNAIKHGNRMNKSKIVTITGIISATIFEITIQDQGSGFNPEEVPDPTTDENLERPCGRGIMLMHTFMDEVDYSNNGTTVTMKKSAHGDGGKIPIDNKTTDTPEQAPTAKSPTSDTTMAAA